ncbi:unnamed protein product [Schistosoma mattheei]|uniref:Uncharacterized protein n=1 Tax=Schistosoma mattheei TaxID=31246 RepID=A0A183PT78_9TREM|nr:unnamed protein product [Schistosoma mattheei]
MAEMACQTVSPVCTVIRNADMEAINCNLIKEGSGSEMMEKDQEKNKGYGKLFLAVFTQKTLLDEELDPNTNSTNRLLIVDFDRDDVHKALSTLDTETSTVPNELHLKILRHFAQYIPVPLTVIFNMSLGQGVLPMD